MAYSILQDFSNPNQIRSTAITQDYTIELATETIARPVLETTPILSESQRSFRCINRENLNKAYKTYTLPAVAAVLLAGFVIYVVILMFPDKGIHPNECDSIELFKARFLVYLPRYIDFKLCRVLVEHNVTMNLDPVISSFSSSLAEVVDTQTHIYYGDCSQTHKISDCNKIDIYFSKALLPAIPLFTIALNSVIRTTNISLTATEFENNIIWVREALCILASQNKNHFCPFDIHCPYLKL